VIYCSSAPLKSGHVVLLHRLRHSVDTSWYKNKSCFVLLFFCSFVLSPSMWNINIHAKYFARPSVPAKHPSQKEVEEIGRSTWTLLHSIAKYFPDRPTTEEKQAVQELLHALSVLYSCRRCSGVLQMVSRNQLVDSTDASRLSLSLCNVHNFVNRKLGKPEVECALLLPPQKVSVSRALSRGVQSVFSTLRLSLWGKRGTQC
ncbi:mitochondrial FAD-linked sulfhydryl oxidase, partial [Nematocida sp. AWRm77]